MDGWTLPTLSGDTIATLEQFVTIEMLDEESTCGAARRVAELSMRVRKSGRTTGVSTGEIVQVQVTADALLGQRTARFTDQVMAGAMSQGGDSGSLVVDEEAVRLATDRFLGVEGVVSVGLQTGSHGSPEVVIGLDRPVNEVRTLLPADVGGVPIALRYVGDISAEDV